MHVKMEMKNPKLIGKKEIDEFLNLVDGIKENSKKNNLDYDCIVPWSGGKDSTSIALKELKLNFKQSSISNFFSFIN